jgi:hypothetical protein
LEKDNVAPYYDTAIFEADHFLYVGRRS